MSDYTAAEKLEELERELKMRRRVYPRWIAERRMTAALMNRRIGILEAIAADYREQAKAERLL